MARISRRAFLISAGAAALSGACGGQRSRALGEGDEEPAAAASTTPRATLTLIASDTPTPAATSTPTTRPKGVEERVLLAGTASETVAVIRHSGVRGNTVVVLGGVHGNEPGAWLAADQVAAWEPAAGSLVVIPRCNVQGIAGFVRTTEEIGDLNRLYPGNLESELLMEQMAATILELAREFEAQILLDMHESWAFYAEYPPNSGTGALGQTVTTGVGPLGPGFGRGLIERVNPSFSEREQMIIRDGTQFSQPPATPTPGQANRGRSSLSAGRHVAGLTPVLVEMGQEHQRLERRIELHLATARATLEIMGVLPGS
jgi:Succinylglutamate desuccinylase / Aspartoacylase family